MVVLPKFDSAVCLIDLLKVSSETMTGASDE